MKGFSKFDKMLGDFCGYDVLEALIYALQHGDDVVNGEDDFTYQASFAFVDYTPCIDTITAQCSIKSRTDFTFTIQYSNDVMEAVKVGKKPLVNESLCMLFDSIDDVIDSIVDCSAAGDMHKWLDMVAKKIRTEFIAAHAFIDANEEAQEAEKKIAEEQEAAKKANAEEEKNTLTDSILKFIDHVYDYENGKYKDDKEFMENVKKDIKDLGSDAFTRIVDGLSGITKELSARLDELQDKMNSEKTETDDSKTPDPDATANDGEAKEEESGCNYCGGTCCPGCPDGCSDDEDEEDEDDPWNDDYDPWDDEFDIAELIEEHISASLLMSVHHKLMHTKDTSIAGDIASNFFYDCFEKAAVRLRENKLRIDTVRRGSPLGGSYELEVYDRTTDKVVWCQTFDLLNVTPEMILPYAKKINGRKYTTADFSTTDVRSMIFIAINRFIHEELNEKELELAIAYVEGWDTKSTKELTKIQDHMVDWFTYFFVSRFRESVHDIAKVRTNSVPELEEYIKSHVNEDEEDDDE